MVNILAISYNNIGPFKDKNISIFFDVGNILIKAPIGSGKSFLFFDGPLFALYKSVSRNMLNVESKEGYIKLIFEVQNQYYLIIRNLKKGKTKDSCTSQLYTINDEKALLTALQEHGGIEENKDIQEIITTKKIQHELVDFKNEIDLQQNLGTLLPPKEVLITTIFLLQDSENIFELMPAERITILKNIFGLLGIDEAKESIAEKRKELQTQIKIFSDDSKYNEKLKNNIKAYIEKMRQIQEIEEIKNTIEENTKDIREIENIQDKVTINNFSSDIFSSVLHTDINEKIQEKKKKYQHKEQEVDNNKKDLQKLEEKENGYKQEANALEKEYKEIVLKINEIKGQNIESTKKEKEEIYHEQKKIEDTLPKKEIQSFLKSNEEITIHKVYSTIKEAINKGKLLNEEKKLQESEKEKEEMQKKNTIQQIMKDLERKEEKKKIYETMIENIGKKKTQLKDNIEKQEQFKCEKIESNCPFIKIINKKTFDQLEQQNKELQEEENQLIEALEKEYKQKEIDEMKKEIENLSKEDHNKIRDEKLKEKENEIQEIKTFLQTIDYKTREEEYNQYQTLQEKIKELDRIIAENETQQQKLQTYEIEKGKIESKKEQLQKAQKEHEETKHILEKEYNDNMVLLHNIDITKRITLEKTNQEMQTHINSIQEITHEYKETQLKVKQLYEDEKIMNNLYQIFSKELLLIVLEDNLPILTDIINAYLGQVVEYQISLQLVKTTTDKIELEAKITDEKGNRDIKSLSGGQKTILKLVWMLAISSFMQTKLLFLDETINNLDGDTVGKVSDMMIDFVKKNNIKFYTVTHNPQIQDMKIWDNILQVDQFLAKKI